MPTVSAPPGAPLLPLAAARRLLADLTRRAPLPTAPHVLDKYAFGPLGAVVVGDVALHGHKVRGKWTVREDDVRAAAASLARPVDLRDLVPLPLPGPSSPPWQHGLFRAVEAVTAYDGSHAPFFQTLADRERVCDLREVHGVRVLSAVVWAADEWRIPRGLRSLFHRGARVWASLAAAARHCAGCGADGAPDPWASGWRRSTAAGWLTLCPACATAGAAPYAGELEGARYRKGLTPAPSRYVCRLCPDRATLWDHCHAHGYVRGPLCWSCNQAEARWLESAGGREHLWSCVQCRTERTLPVRQLLHIAQHGPVPYRHKGCTLEPIVQWAEEVGITDETGPVVQIPVICARHGHRWSEPVPRADLVAAARERMTQAATAG